MLKVRGAPQPTFQLSTGHHRQRFPNSFQDVKVHVDFHKLPCVPVEGDRAKNSEKKGLIFLVSPRPNEIRGERPDCRLDISRCTTTLIWCSPQTPLSGHPSPLPGCNASASELAQDATPKMNVKRNALPVQRVARKLVTILVHT